MQAKDEMVEQIGEAYGHFTNMLDKKMEEYKLAAAEKSALTASKVILGLIMGTLLVVMSTFGLIALAFYLAGDMANTAWGFLMVALMMLVLMILTFLLRKQLIINPAVTKVITLFFAESDKEVTK